MLRLIATWQIIDSLEKIYYLSEVVIALVILLIICIDLFQCSGGYARLDGR